MYTYTHVCVYAYIYIYACMYVCMRIYICMHVCVYAYIYIYTRQSPHLHSIARIPTSKCPHIIQ